MCGTQAQRVKFLYKTILRLHRGLPEGLSELGTTYARDEFKRHRNCNPQEAHVFITEWTKYAITLAEQLGLKGVKSSTQIGAPIMENQLDDFRDDQVAQLYELMQAASLEKSKDPPTL